MDLNTHQGKVVEYHLQVITHLYLIGTGFGVFLTVKNHYVLNKKLYEAKSSYSFSIKGYNKIFFVFFVDYCPFLVFICFCGLVSFSDF